MIWITQNKPDKKDFTWVTEWQIWPLILAQITKFSTPLSDQSIEWTEMNW